MTNLSNRLDVIGGKLMVFKGEDVLRDRPALVTVCDFTQDAELEIAFDDAGRRYYLRFSLAEVLSHIGTAHGSKP